MRLFRIDQLIHEHGQVSSELLLSELRCSLPTLKRDLAYLRSELSAPIVYNRRSKTYGYAAPRRGRGERPSRHPVALPSAWYSPLEMSALLTALQLFKRVESEPDGLLSRDMQAMRSRLLSLICQERISVRELLRRVKVVLPQYVTRRPPHFETIGAALARRRRVRVSYWTRSSGDEKIRELSPLRLIEYKGHWYLQAWCHLSRGIRTFNLDYVRSAEPLAKNCQQVSLEKLSRMDRAFGIFSGERTQTAVIAFDRLAGPFVRDEVWHPEQRLVQRDDGRLELSLPYADGTELLAQVMRWGDHAEVLAPDSLRRAVAERLARALALYRGAEP